MIRQVRSLSVRGELWALVAITVAAGALRFATLDVQSFHHDEAVTAGRVLQPGFAEMLETVRDSERNGPLYYVLAWLWSKLFGTGEVGLRSLSALFGTAVVPVAYLAATRFADRRAAVIAATLVALSPYLFWYSQEARPYALLVLMIALGLLFLLGASARPTGRDLALWALASAAALATHYFALFIVVPEALWLLYACRGRQALAAVGAVGVVGLSLLPLALEQSQEGARNLFAELSLSDRVLDLGVRSAGGEELSPCTELIGLGCDGATLGALAVGLGVAGLVLLALLGSPEERRGGFLAAGIGLAGVAVPLLMAVAGYDLFNPRNLVGVLLPLLVAAAAGFGVHPTGPLGRALAALLAAAFVGGLVAILTDEEIQRPDWRAVAEEIGPASRARLIISPLDGDDPLDLYLDGVQKLGEAVTDIGQERTQGRSTSVDELVVVTRLPDPPSVEGFELADRSRGGEYAVYRYRAPEPRLVDPAEVEGVRLVGSRFVVLLQGAGE